MGPAYSWRETDPPFVGLSYIALGGVSLAVLPTLPPSTKVVTEDNVVDQGPTTIINYYIFFMYVVSCVLLIKIYD